MVLRFVIMSFFSCFLSLHQLFSSQPPPPPRLLFLHLCKPDRGEDVQCFRNVSTLSSFLLVHCHYFSFYTRHHLLSSSPPPHPTSLCVSFPGFLLGISLLSAFYSKSNHKAFIQPKLRREWLHLVWLIHRNALSEEEKAREVCCFEVDWLPKKRKTWYLFFPIKWWSGGSRMLEKNLYCFKLLVSSIKKENVCRCLE